MATRVLAAEARSGRGKNVNGRLRKEGYIPAVINSHGQSDAVLLKEKDFKGVFKGQISESVLVELDIAGKEKVQVFVKDYQLHPVTDRITHVDFYKITAGEKIHTIVPVELTGFSVGQKQGGVVTIVEHQLSVKVLPADLQEKIVIDVTNLDLGQAIRIKDLKVPASMTFAFDAEHIVVHCVVPKAEASEAAEGAEPAKA